MQYLLMINDDEKKQLGPGSPGFEEVMAEYKAFGEMIEKMGVVRGAARLQPTSTATTLRVRDGKTLVTEVSSHETGIS